MIHWLGLLILLTSSLDGFAQTFSSITNELLDDKLNDDIIASDLLILNESLESYYSFPLDLNKAGHEDLEEIGIFTDLQISEMLQHIHDFGPLISIEELQSINSFSLNDIQKIRNFVVVNESIAKPHTISNMLREGKNEIYLKWSRGLEKQRGFLSQNNSPPSYLGDSNKFFVKFRHSYQNKMQLGFILEKDAGEKFGNNFKSLGFDYQSFHMHLKNYSNRIKDLIVGDFSISAGQGLIYHSDFSTGKSSIVNNVIKGGRYIKAYNSINENANYRGVATSISLNRFMEYSAFVSKSNRDGNILYDSSQVNITNEFVSSFQNTGNHRTVEELADKKSLVLLAYGSRLKFIGSQYHVALNAVHHKFNPGLARKENIYNLFRFSGTDLSNVSIDYNVRLNNLNLFGETAYSLKYGMANIAGLLISIDKDATISVLHRYYARNYNALMPNAHGETTGVNNEKGIYLGFSLSLNNYLSMNGYADFWRHPWIRSTVSQLSGGKEFLLKCNYNVKRKINIYIQYLYEEKLENMSLAKNPIVKVQSQSRHKLRLNVRHYPTKSFESRTRLELISFSNSQKTSFGILIFQDFIYRNITSPVSFTSRIALFDTDDFDSRIYAYENSLLNEFSIPAYSGQGFRYYLNLRFKLNLSIMIEFRLSRTHLIDRDFFGSANSHIDSDTKTDVSLQLRFQF